MITERKITPDFADFEKFQTLYQTAFPEEERMPLADLMRDDGAMQLIACCEDDDFCGFYATLTLKDITHVLFFAVAEQLRDRGYGSQVLGLIAKRFPKNRIIADIEAEDPAAENNAQRIRRKAFYQRNGYTESEVAYVWRGVPYQILVKNGTITEAEFENFWKNFHNARKRTI